MASVTKTDGDILFVSTMTLDGFIAEEREKTENLMKIKIKMTTDDEIFKQLKNILRAIKISGGR